ncbi:hypothetical protein SGGMMB4_02865 [Sodalis glossinidius str. 'morsitans']|uniref:Lipoprotein n=1 Tax=Sodalis glossinidius (strain morsitans) TaxID=343509 RepID=Q2NTI4_SODGM|nr:DUF1460 domain-containing protein [Sodalis glossinidius]BAE74541.1 conserved hypothetical protein [Sodalis glossinidius str. 'morsitans']CRL45258.1 hypothetical protein SGGMMB4_02865 [Sodalis glossinidius str. 'morsitans']
MRQYLIIPLCLLLSACSPKKYPVAIDAISATKAQHIINDVQTHEQESRGELIELVSQSFLSTPYQANILIGSATEPEKLVVDFNGVDCFTMLDYVHALSQSSNKADFLGQLVKTRYKNGKVSFVNRKHFFTDWFASQSRNARDVTTEISPNSKIIHKQLNLKADGGRFIPAIGVFERDITYIPAQALDQNALAAIHTGDYIGIYSKLDGLDVSHVGIAIRKGDQLYYRNASSLQRNHKVVDIPFIDYMRNKPGIVVLRAL